MHPLAANGLGQGRALLHHHYHFPHFVALHIAAELARQPGGLRAALFYLHSHSRTHEIQPAAGRQRVFVDVFEPGRVKRRGEHCVDIVFSGRGGRTHGPYGGDNPPSHIFHIYILSHHPPAGNRAVHMTGPAGLSLLRRWTV